MRNNRARRAVIPGAFDPVTNGHIDLIRRAADFVDDLIVAVGENPEKHPVFTASERVEMLEELLKGMEHVRVEAYIGLTADFVQKVNATTIIRGIRDNVDLHFELQQANVNLIVGGVETIFLLTRDQFALTSSTYIKQIVELGCRDIDRLTRLVPPSVAARLMAKFGRPA